MPDRDDPLELLRQLRDVGVTPPRTQVLHARVSAAIADETEREHQSRRGGLNGGSPGRPTAERLGGARRRLGFPRLAGRLAPVVGVLVVALVVAVFLGLHGSGPSSPAPSHGSVTPSHGSVELVYLAEPSAQAPAVTRGALERTVEVIRERLRALGIGAARVSVSSANEITVVLPKVRNTAQAEREVGTTAQLSFYDWEANALTPNGKTVASQLQAQFPTAMKISQGSGPWSPGSPSAGSMGLYQAVRLASKQPHGASPDNSRIGSQYWLFGAPGTAACATAARDQGTVPFAGQHCLLSGPDETLNDLKAGLPAGVSASEGQILTVPRGTVVLQAIPASFADPVPIGDPSAQFFVLKDDVALRSSDITNPQQRTDPNRGPPVITFGFTSKGKSEFQNATAEIARRGALVSGLGQSLNQHFAVVLDNQLITVPFIDFKQYPDGINGDQGAEISGPFSISSAQDLANELRFGALPLNLKLICGSTPATTPCPRTR
jgi:SecD/SecF fusion protein